MLYPGLNVGVTVSQRGISAGALETGRTLYGWAGLSYAVGLNPTVVTSGRPLLATLEGTQIRIATVPAGEPDAGRKYVGISFEYVSPTTYSRLDGWTNLADQITADQRTAFFNLGTRYNTEYGGGHTYPNLGWRMIWIHPNARRIIAGLPPSVYPIRYAQDGAGGAARNYPFHQRVLLFGGAPNRVPHMFVEKIVPKRIQFRSYTDRTIGLIYEIGNARNATRRTASEIVEHRIFLVDNAGQPYNFADIRNLAMDEDVYWFQADADARDRLNAVLHSQRQMPWVYGAPGTDSILLGPETPLEKVRLDILGVELQPAVEADAVDVVKRTNRIVSRFGWDIRHPIPRQELANAGDIGMGYGVPAIDAEVPRYSRGGLEVLSGRALLIESEAASDLDGLWSIEKDGETFEYTLLDAQRRSLLEYDVVLKRDIHQLAPTRPVDVSAEVINAIGG